jgi:hypothetical protein
MKGSTNPFARVSILLATAGGLVPACTDSRDTNERDFNHPASFSTNYAISEEVPTVASVNWVPEVEGTSYIEYGLDDAFDLTTPIFSASNGEYSIPLYHMKAGQTYQYRAVTETADGSLIYSELDAIALDPADSALPQLEIMTHDDASTDGGYFLISYMQPFNSFVAIIDRDGDYVWYRRADEGMAIPTAEMSIDGQSILVSQNERYQDADTGSIVRMSLDGSEVVETKMVYGHHDFVEHSDGTLGYLALQFQQMSVQGQSVEVAADTLVEVVEGADQFTSRDEIYSFLDDYEVEPFEMCDHFFTGAYGTNAADWTHVNSMMYDPNDDAYFLLSRNLDALFKIDRASGELEWEMGGIRSDFQPVPGTDSLWSHGHMSHIWNGGMMVFNNGDHQSPERSSFAEYRYDEETMTVEKVFEYTDPQGRFISMLGDTKKLPNGNYIAAWTTAGFITEVSPDGAVVWQANSELGSVLSRTTWISDLYSGF